MRITCPNCSKALTVPDEKAPPRPFHLTCPACQKRFEVGATPAGKPATGEIPVGRRAFDLPPKLTPAEKELLDSVDPTAYVVELADTGVAGLNTGLAQLGMRDVRRFETLDEAVDALLETEAGILLIRMEKASRPPCKPLEALERLSYALRRRTFVVLMAENVRSLDGQLAFYLQVNCLVATQDADRLAAIVRRALLHHLRLYRHWTSAPGA